MNRRIATLLVVLITFIVVAQPAGAYGRDKHNNDIESVLFNANNPQDPSASEIITALQYAVFLAVDQYNGSGSTELEWLRSIGVDKLPLSVNEMNFTSNYAHRRFTHQGWDFVYPEEAHWPVRKSIVINTVQHMLFSNNKWPLSWFPWLSRKTDGISQSEKRDSFCAFLYYIHILGDHIEAKEYNQLEYVVPLVCLDETPSLISEIKKHLNIMFYAQKSSYTYLALIGELDNLESKAKHLMGSQGGINTEEKFKEYHQCAEDVMSTLKDFLPTLFKKESFSSGLFKKSGETMK